MTTSATEDRGPGGLPKIQRVIAVLWPSFLMAGLATILFFTVFDPFELAACAGLPEVSRLGGYSLGFFMFWSLTGTSCALTCFFQRPCTPKSRLRPPADAD